MRKTAFNLVEILVAMAILTIGMVGLVGIIPVSTEALASANGKLYAAEIGQFMSDYVSADCDGLTPTDVPGDGTKLRPVTSTFELASTSASSVLVRNYMVTFGSYKLSRNFSSNTPPLGTTGLFIVDHSTIVTGGTVVDFSAFVNLEYIAATRTMRIDVNWPAKTSADNPLANRAAGRTATFYRVVQP